MLNRPIHTAYMALILLLATGCATHRLQPDIDKTPSHAFPPSQSGAAYEIAQKLNNSAAENESEFMLLADNMKALHWRVLLADLAEKSIDVQYYLIDRDESSQYFAQALVRAAYRGVRIRLLVDDVFLMNREDRIALWNKHPNIEIRVFNPWHKRGSLLQKGLEYIGYSQRLNQRMHNKLFAVDNQIAIVGGRNIGNAYFGLADRYNFRDIDFVVAGPIVDKVSDSFDIYWNDEWTVSASALANPRQKPLTENELIRESHAMLAQSDKVKVTGLLEPFPRQSYLNELSRKSVYGQAWAVYDDPPSVTNTDTGVRKIEHLKDIDAEITRELLIASPYFVPSDIFLEKLQALAERGIRVRVLTNSLASTNHTMVHSGYRPWRRRLLKAGIDLYEYRSDARDTLAVVGPGIKSGFTSLHTKTFVIDREFVYAGSLNMDPRSFHINTEMGLLVASPPLAEQVAELIERDMTGNNAWRVTLDEENRLVWTSGNGSTHLQPARGLGQRIADFFYGLLPIKDQL